MYLRRIFGVAILILLLGLMWWNRLGALRVMPMTVEQRIEKLISQMTLNEKIGQMVLVEKFSIQKNDLAQKGIGGLLSGGGGNPPENTPTAWREMVVAYQQEAMRSRLRIPILYGVDAVHGHGNMYGAVIFPHVLGLGATRNTDLVRETARVTAREMRAAAANWNYAPVLSLPQDIRWGRTYEAFSEDVEIVTSLGRAYVEGLHDEHVLSSPKHFIGEGREMWKSSREYLLDQGEIAMSSGEVLRNDLAPFAAAIRGGAMSIMVSRSSVDGSKISTNRRLLTDVVKGELGFQGFLVSDWGAIDQISDDRYANVVTSINAGIDMVMVPVQYDQFIADIQQAVRRGDIAQERVTDAARRILRAKFSIGLFDEPVGDAALLSKVGSAAHRAVARQAVRESLVLLKNNEVLPLKDVSTVLVYGRGADDIGLQSGGWTIEWQGGEGSITPGTTMLEGLRSVLTEAKIVYVTSTRSVASTKADVAIVVIAEQPYAEGKGDTESVELTALERGLITSAKQNAKQVILVLVAGRPRIISSVLPSVDAVVMAWLPGTEGAGVAEVLSGQYPFVGMLPITWPQSMDQVRLPRPWVEPPQYPLGYGLRYVKGE
ncbi:MAG: glycoside hydrolase family 3 N-terminal domain-containing protein [Patescibacteria group bacterium]